MLNIYKKYIKNCTKCQLRFLAYHSGKTASNERKNFKKLVNVIDKVMAFRYINNSL